MSNVELKDLQKKELEILSEFQRICNDNGLSYSSIGGTCLGAIRHKGFIPWDDDIDVVMPYKDYKRFFKIVRSLDDSVYGIKNNYNCRHFIASFSKLHDKRTTFIEECNLNFKDRWGGVFIDIFPVYRVPSSHLAQWFILIVVEITNKLNIYHRYPMDKSYKVHNKMIHRIVRILFSKKPITFFSKIQDDFLLKYDDNKKNDCLIFPWRGRPQKNYTYKTFFYARDFEQLLEVPFENMTIKVPKGYNRYLTMDFGDYMTPPPEKDRVGYHNKSIVDLKESYLMHRHFR